MSVSTHENPPEKPHTQREQDEHEEYYMLLDWGDVRDAINGSQLALVETKWRARMKARLRGMRRGCWEVVLALPSGSTWTLARFDKGQKDEAVEAYREAGEDPIAWSLRMDQETGTTDRRMPFAAALHEAQVARTGVMPGDIVETTQVIEVPLGEDQVAVIAAGARVIVDQVWLGVQRGVVCTPLRRDDLKVPMDPSQLRLVVPTPHPARLEPRHWLFHEGLDAWINLEGGGQ